MKREDIVKIFGGLTADNLAESTEKAVEKIYVLHGKDIEGHKTKLVTSSKEIDSLKDQLKEANTAIDGFKELDSEGIKKAADDWKATAQKYKKDAKEATEASDKKFADLKYDTALNEALKDAKVINTKAVKSLLNIETIILNEKDELVGFDEQIETLRESDPNQFAPDEDTPRIVDGTKPTTVLKSDDADLATAMKFAGVSEVKEK